MAADFSHVGSFRIEFRLIHQTLENCFKVGINDERNSKLVLPTMQSHRSHSVKTGI